MVSGIVGFRNLNDVFRILIFFSVFFWVGFVFRFYKVFLVFVSFVVISFRIRKSFFF